MSDAATIPAPAGRERAWSGGTDFDELPPERLVRAFGVEYAHLGPPEGGDLYVTREGWPHVATLTPDRWYVNGRYKTDGVRMHTASGTVYHLRLPEHHARPLELVVKFSRVAQDVPLVLATQFPAKVTAEQFAAARFNSPMEEFGLLAELRRAARGPGRRLLTQRPLAIYAPPEEFDLWELGRQTSSFHSHRLQLAEDQIDSVKAIELDIRRIYVLLFGWISGRDAEECFDAGLLDEGELHALSSRVATELDEAGFLVLDNKPRHFILRQRSDGSLLRQRDGRLAFGLVDFELLQRTAEHQERHKAERRERYWHLQFGARPSAPESNLRHTRVFGVDYTFGTTPDGGRLWVVGHEPELFDYFIPDRWRRTTREKISATSEVYHSRSRDQVDIVYRRSRVGLLPRADPLTAAGRSIREAGYNSPFEEFALAVRLREMGIRTVFPRAIYETGHETVKAFRLRDPRRYANHARCLSPEEPPRPTLRPDHDYYTIWDTYRGADPLPPPGRRAAGGALGLDRARELGLLSADETAEALARVRQALARTALPPEGIADEEFVVALGPDEGPLREGGKLRLLFSLDALTAYDYGLLPEAEYLEVMQRTDERLRAADCEKLDPNGRHLLLTVDSDGRLLRDADGAARVVLCNLALIRGLYRPIH
jgi:hypothetical protein